MKKIPAILVALIILLGLPGILYFSFFVDEDSDETEVEPGPFDFEEPIPSTTFYHFAGGVNATEAVANGSYDLTANNTPFLAQGTYYSIGTTTFEPTIGSTSTGSLFMSNWGGLGRGTHVIRSQDQGQTWEDMGPFFQLVPNSNDPYIYVDPWTDRIIKFDMHALAAMTFEYSDNEGESWSIANLGRNWGPYPQDHQTIASMPPPPGFVTVNYPNVLVYCINTGVQGAHAGGSYCSSSFDGGLTWPTSSTGFPPETGQCSGLTAHLVGADDGSIYRGNPACPQGDQRWDPAAYRSLDAGLTWTEHTISTTTGSQSHEVALGTDEANNVHAFWIGNDNLPYYSSSNDRGETWREAMMVAPPGVTGTGFPTIAGGAEGRAAFSYIGQHGNGTWSGYLGVVTDGFADQPLFTTVAVNMPDDPLDETEDCGYRRCGGFGDFIDITIDPEGRPWAALAHNPSGEIGIVGTFATGPSLRGDLDYLPPLPPGEPLGGPEILSKDVGNLNNPPVSDIQTFPPPCIPCNGETFT